MSSISKFISVLLEKSANKRSTICANKNNSEKNQEKEEKLEDLKFKINQSDKINQTDKVKKTELN